MIASDYQEAKNIDTIGAVDHAEHADARSPTMRVVRGAAVDWLAPAAGACVATGGSSSWSSRRARRGGVASVRFAVDGRQVAVDRSERPGRLVRVGSRPLKRGAHTLTATAVGRERRTRCGAT